MSLRPDDTIFVPPAPKVYVTGEVRSAGAYAFSPGTTVMQAISLAGGFTEYASSGRIRITRKVDGKTRKVSVELDDLVRADDQRLTPAQCQQYQQDHRGGREHQLADQLLRLAVGGCAIVAGYLHPDTIWYVDPFELVKAIDNPLRDLDRIGPRLLRDGQRHRRRLTGVA